MTPALETYLAEVEAAEGRMTIAPWRHDTGEFLTHWISSPMSTVAVIPTDSVHCAHEVTENCDGIALLRNRVKALCGMVRDAVSTLEAITVCTSDRQRIVEAADHSLARLTAAVALIAKGQGEGRESQPVNH